MQGIVSRAEQSNIVLGARSPFGERDLVVVLHTATLAATSAIFSNECALPFIASVHRSLHMVCDMAMCSASWQNANIDE